MATRSDKPGPDPGEGGRPAWEPTAEERKLVASLAAYGVRQEEIAAVVSVSVDSLARHCRKELDTGAIRANARVAEALYQKAVNGNVTAMIFWLKTRARWRETDRLEVTDPESKPLGSGAVAELMNKLDGIAERKAAAVAELVQRESTVVTIDAAPVGRRDADAVNV